MCGVSISFDISEEELLVELRAIETAEAESKKCRLVTVCNCALLVSEKEEVAVVLAVKPELEGKADKC